MSDPSFLAVTASGVAGVRDVTTEVLFFLAKLQLVPSVIMPRFSAWPVRPTTNFENDAKTSIESLIE